MDKENAILALAALAQSTRLDTFRLLVAHEPGWPGGGRDRAATRGAAQHDVDASRRAGARRADRRRAPQPIDHLPGEARIASARLRPTSLKDCCGGHPEICAPLIEEITPCCSRRRLPMADRVYNVLFLCTGNSARSIFAEVHPQPLRARPLQGLFGRFASEGQGASLHARSAAEPALRHGRPSLEETGTSSRCPARPMMDFVFTVCDDAANEVLPDLARPADDRALGDSRPGGGRRHRRRSSALPSPMRAAC